jgi:hypothetical protein
MATANARRAGWFAARRRRSLSTDAQQEQQHDQAERNSQ